MKGSTNIRVVFTKENMEFVPFLEQMFKGPEESILKDTSIDVVDVILSIDEY